MVTLAGPVTVAFGKFQDSPGVSLQSLQRVCDVFIDLEFFEHHPPKKTNPKATKYAKSTRFLESFLSS